MSGHCSKCGQTGGCDCNKPDATVEQVSDVEGLARTARDWAEGMGEDGWSAKDEVLHSMLCDLASAIETLLRKHAEDAKLEAALRDFIAEQAKRIGELVEELARQADGNATIIARMAGHPGAMFAMLRGMLDMQEQTARASIVARA